MQNDTSRLETINAKKFAPNLPFHKLTISGVANIQPEHKSL